MNGINKDIIADVVSRSNILEVISEHVVLKRTGKEYKGLCPFHPEKTPSFHVNPEKRMFKCFGCGESGDAITFVKKAKKLDFVDAVRDLAVKYGIALIETESERGEYDKRSTLMLLYQQAAEYFARLLEDPREGLVGREYLDRRGISPELATRFKLGYAPPVWDGLLRYLTHAAQVTTETLVEAGLVRRKPDSDHCFDLFRNRLMIPIQDDQGRVIAFGGRTLGDDQVKYLNSPETLLYTKGEHLFALNQAKDSIRDRDAVIVVEGYFDAITAHAFGFTNTVAALGTALTERQGKLLVRYTDSRRVLLSFDADSAGAKAVERGMEVLSNIAEGVGIEMRVVRVPGAKDPDECLRSTESGAGLEGFTQAVENAPLLIDYRLELAVHGIDTNTNTGRIDAAGKVVPVLATIKSPIARAEYARSWATTLGIREEDLLSEVGTYRRGKRMGASDEKSSRQSFAVAKNAPKSGHVEAELQLLSLYLISPEDYELMREKFTDRMLDPIHQRIKEAIVSIGKFVTAEDFWQRLAERLAPDHEAKQQLWDLDRKVEEIRKQNLATEVILKDARYRLLQERLNQALTTTRVRMRQQPGEEEEVRLSSRIGKLQKLQTAFYSNSRSEQELEELKAIIDAALVEAT